MILRTPIKLCSFNYNNYLNSITEYTEKSQRRTNLTNMDTDLLTENIIGCAIEVHKNLGPGMLEYVYEKCLCYELKLKGLSVKSQVPIPVMYKEIYLDCGYRLDLLVNDLVIIEIKSIDNLLPVHTSQILTYMRFSDKRIGLLMNFNVKKLMDGFHRYVL